jgi:hypothetical protein
MMIFKRTRFYSVKKLFSNELTSLIIDKLLDNLIVPNVAKGINYAY